MYAPVFKICDGSAPAAGSPPVRNIFDFAVVVVSVVAARLAQPLPKMPANFSPGACRARVSRTFCLLA